MGRSFSHRSINLSHFFLYFPISSSPACKECDRLWRDTFPGIPKENLKQMILHKML